jgi:hypothetical protein
MTDILTRAAAYVAEYDARKAHLVSREIALPDVEGVEIVRGLLELVKAHQLVADRALTNLRELLICTGPFMATQTDRANAVNQPPSWEPPGFD